MSALLRRLLLTSSLAVPGAFSALPLLAQDNPTTRSFINRVTPLSNGEVAEIRTSDGYKATFGINPESGWLYGRLHRPASDQIPGDMDEVGVNYNPQAEQTGYWVTRIVTTERSEYRGQLEHTVCTINMHTGQQDAVVLSGNVALRDGVGVRVDQQFIIELDAAMKTMFERRNEENVTRVVGLLTRGIQNPSNCKPEPTG